MSEAYRLPGGEIGPADPSAYARRQIAETLAMAKSGEIHPSSAERQHVLSWVANAEEWVKRGACREPGMSDHGYPFFSVSRGRNDNSNYELDELKADRLSREARAKEICGRCTVREECLGYATRHHESSGIWGGMNEEERGVVKKRRHS